MKLNKIFTLSTLATASVLPIAAGVATSFVSASNNNSSDIATNDIVGANQYSQTTTSDLSLEEKISNDILNYKPKKESRNSERATVNSTGWINSTQTPTDIFDIDVVETHWSYNSYTYRETKTVKHSHKTYCPNRCNKSTDRITVEKTRKEKTVLQDWKTETANIPYRYKVNFNNLKNSSNNFIFSSPRKLSEKIEIGLEIIANHKGKEVAFEIPSSKLKQLYNLNHYQVAQSTSVSTNKLFSYKEFKKIGINSKSGWNDNVITQRVWMPDRTFSNELAPWDFELDMWGYQLFENGINSNFDYSVIESIDLSNFFSIELNSGNSYAKDGISAFKKAPEINFKWNDEFIGVLNELYEITLLASEANEKFHSTSGELQKQYSKIYNNAIYYKKTLDEIKEDMKRAEKFQVVTEGVGKPEKFLNFEKLSGINLSVNLNTVLFLYNSFLELMKETPITIQYKTTSGIIKNHTMWDGKKFIPLKAEAAITQNRNFIEILGFKPLENLTKNGVDVKGLNVNNIKLTKAKDVTQEFPNITRTASGGIRYEFLYKNNVDPFVEKLDANNDNEKALELPNNRYLSEVVNLSTGQIYDLAEFQRLVGDKLSAKTDDGKKFIVPSEVGDVESAEVSINPALSKAAGQKLGLNYNEQTKVFDRYQGNDYEGIYYGVIGLSNWLYEGEKDGDIVQGIYTKTFIDSMKNNKDMAYLGTTGRKGYFLLRCKTNVVKSNEKELAQPVKAEAIKNDKKNPLSYLNTKEVLNSIDKQIKDSSSWIKKEVLAQTVEKKPNSKGVIEGTRKYETRQSLDLNKEIVINAKEIKINQYPMVWNRDLQEYQWDLIPWGSVYPFDDKPANDGLTVDAIDNELHKYIWKNPLNFSNEETKKGKIVSKQYSEKYKKDIYVLNPEYSENWNVIRNFEQAEQFVEVGDYSLGNKNNIKEFTYKITIGELIELFKDYKDNPIYQADYKKHADEINKLTQKVVSKREEKYYKTEWMGLTPSTPNKPSLPNNGDTPSDSIDGVNQSSAVDNKTALAIALPISILVMVAIVVTIILVYRKKSAKI